jgi:Ni/Fe-hydrogenase subunit HybB-like protein
MSDYVNQVDSARSWFKEKIILQDRVTEYLKGLVTPFNVVAAVIILMGFSLIVLRFATGLGAVTNASQDQPWGLFLSWGLFSGVPMSAAGFVLGTAVYVFGLKEYHPVVKNAVLVGLLGYLFAVIFLLIDLGRPWRLPYPMIGNFGTASVLFLVAWHVALYLTCQFLEFFPSILEWGGWRALRQRAAGIIIGLTILGVLLSTLHQSALGAMFLIAPGKLHPLWYTPYLPVLFFVSAIAAGICMVIFVSQMTRYFFKKQGDREYFGSLDNITLGLGKAAAFALITYFGLKIVTLAHGNHWDLLNTPLGYWFLVELLGFVLLPCLLFIVATKRKSVGLVRFTAILTILGIIVNRFNVSMVALNWQLPGREFFNWSEILIVVSVITLEIVVYRWIVNRMPVLRQHPDYKD